MAQTTNYHFEPKIKDKLSIDIILTNSANGIVPPKVSAKITLESITTGEIFGRSFETADICAFHRIFVGMPELFVDFTAQNDPMISFTDQTAIVRYSIKKDGRAYEFELLLPKDDKTDDIKLFDKNQELQRRVIELEEQVAKLGQAMELVKPCWRSCICRNEGISVKEHAIKKKKFQEACIREAVNAADDFEVDDFERMIKDNRIDVNMLHVGTYMQYHVAFRLIDCLCENCYELEIFDRMLFMFAHGLSDHESKFHGAWLSEFIRRSKKTFCSKMDSILSPLSLIKIDGPLLALYNNRGEIMKKFEQLEEAIPLKHDSCDR